MYVGVEKVLEYRPKTFYSLTHPRIRHVYCPTKLSFNVHEVVTNVLVLENKETFNLVRITFERNENWHKHVAASLYFVHPS